MKCQMAMETISKAEGLTITEAEFDGEYQSAVAEFGNEKQEFDDAKLREQVTENLKVWCLLCCRNAASHCDVEFVSCSGLSKYAEEIVAFKPVSVCPIGVTIVLLFWLHLMGHVKLSVLFN